MHDIKLSKEKLKNEWELAWNRPIPRKIGRAMLEKSLSYKIRQNSGVGLNARDLARLEQLIRDYRRNPNCFDQKMGSIQNGRKFVRKWQGIEHEVLVTEHGYVYQDLTYASLSKIASLITGTRWNGLVFFGLKKRKQS